MILRDGKQTVVIGAEGANLWQWQMGTSHIIYPPQMTSVGGHMKWRGGNPIPFPFFGPPPEGFSYLPQHGFLREMLPWSVYRDADGAYGQLTFSEKGLRREYNPWLWPFVVRVEFKVSENRLWQEITVSNRHPTLPMPLGIALHPYFCTPKGEAAIHMGGQTYRVGGGVYEEGLVGNDRHITLGIPGLGTVKMALDGLFSGVGAMVSIWTDSTRYVCVEPTVAHPQLFGKPGGVYVPPRKTTVLSWTLHFTPE